MAQFFTNSIKRSVSQEGGGEIIYIISYSFLKLSVPVSKNKHRATHSFKRKLKEKEEWKRTKSIRELFGFIY